MFTREQLLSFFEKRAGVSRGMRKLTPARSPAQKSSLATLSRPGQSSANLQEAIAGPPLQETVTTAPANINFNQVAKPQSFEPSSLSNLPDPMRAV